MAPWMQQLLDGLGPLGWLALAAGFLMQRKALMKAQVVNRVQGKRNQVTTHIQQTNTVQSEESGLARWGSWASIVGLVLTLWPMVKLWLSATH